MHHDVCLMITSEERIYACLGDALALDEEKVMRDYVKKVGRCHQPEVYQEAAWRRDLWDDELWRVHVMAELLRLSSNEEENTQ